MISTRDSYVYQRAKICRRATFIAQRIRDYVRLPTWCKSGVI
nr:MAG TPA: hypothetical protein [Caudoviricetes sp.]